MDAEASPTKPKLADAGENEAAVARVLQLFVAVLWPKAIGSAVTRSRRVVLGRLRELRQGPNGPSSAEAEQTLCDAVRGAAIHPWHREADQGRHARLVFRDLDKVEELAALGRARRLADEREAARKWAGDPPVTLAVTEKSAAAFKPADPTAASRREGSRVLEALLATWGEAPATPISPARAPALTETERAALCAASERARARVA